MRNYPHDIQVYRQVAILLVLVNAIVLRDDYLEAGGPGYASIACFLLAMLAIGLAVKSKQPL